MRTRMRGKGRVWVWQVQGSRLRTHAAEALPLLALYRTEYSWPMLPPLPSLVTNVGGRLYVSAAVTALESSSSAPERVLPTLAHALNSWQRQWRRYENASGPGPRVSSPRMAEERSHTLDWRPVMSSPPHTMLVSVRC